MFQKEMAPAFIIIQIGILIGLSTLLLKDRSVYREVLFENTVYFSLLQMIPVLLANTFNFASANLNTLHILIPVPLY